MAPPTARSFLATAAGLALGLGFGLSPHSAAAQDPWPQWRGPDSTGQAPPSARPPTTWSESENVLWKIPVPGSGHSTPVVWGDTIILTTAVPVGDPRPPVYSGRDGAHDNAPVTHAHDFQVIALSAADGSLLWATTVATAVPHEGGHVSGTLASASPSTDGERIYAFFGSRGLHALDFDGEVLWSQDFGEMNTKHGHGEGSTPALDAATNTIVVNWDHQEQSWAAAFNTTDGEELWKVERDELTSWSSPIIVRPPGGEPQAVVSATGAVRGYDLATGDVVWEASGLSANVVASPVYADGILYAGSSYNTKSMFALNIAGAAGSLDSTDRVLWRRIRRTPYVPSPLLHDGVLYFLGHYQGVLTRLEAESGEEPTGPFRLGDLRDIYASPASANGHLYVVDRSGITLVLTLAPEPALVSANKLDETFSASPAFSGSTLYLRGAQHLYALRAAD